jgi:cell wall-associated NlpC family hydrolase
MQFMPATWKQYGVDANGDKKKDPYNPVDAIFAAARYLRAAGADRDLARAIFAYNHARWYVDRVMAKADEYRGQFAPGATGGAAEALSWAVAHVGRFSYSLGPPTDRGGSVQDMQTREPSSSTCDCSMFVRWSWAQAGVDVGLTTVTQWTANGLLPDTETAATTPVVSRGVGPSPPPGGYRPADIIFFGHGPGGDGHDALWLGNGLIVQCSSSGGGSNIRALAGYVAPTGWIRWRVVAG